VATLPRPEVLVRGWRTRGRRVARRIDDRVRGLRFAEHFVLEDLPIVLARHSSLLRRQLGDTDPGLQDAKVVNLRLALATLDGLVIAPGETLSFWRRVGRPTAERGYVRGIVLSRGRVSTGIGGGLCQLSNLLYWMALHTPLRIAERHHHSFDPFPDDRRVLPFGSGATVVWTIADLRLRNDSAQPFQVRLWLTDEHLAGTIRTDRPSPVAYHVIERARRFVREGDTVYRENALYRRVVDRTSGTTVREELIARNHALVMYPASLDDAPAATDGTTPL
jgi:vancomycin resistance protein VanW